MFKKYIISQFFVDNIMKTDMFFFELNDVLYLNTSIVPAAKRRTGRDLLR